MRIQLLSDLHFEFQRNRGRTFVADLDPVGIDVLVLAGDICAGEDIGASLTWFADRYAAAQIVYVHGNHEFYGFARQDVVARTRAAVAACHNVHWLDGNAITIAGQRFLGTPLWFDPRKAARNLRSQINDFRLIQDFEQWAHSENHRAITFLEAELSSGDIVVTHYLPHSASIAPAFVGHPLNAFFVCDLAALIDDRQPRLWLHGHTHTSIDARAGTTRIVCNPYGYEGHDQNPRFLPSCTVDVPEPN